jgi:hypothetical protein
MLAPSSHSPRRDPFARARDLAEVEPLAATLATVGRIDDPGEAAVGAAQCLARHSSAAAKSTSNPIG